MADRDDLIAERDRLMAEQERLLRGGVPIEDLARLVDVGEHDVTGDEAPKVTTAPASDSGSTAWDEAAAHRLAEYIARSGDEIILVSGHVCAASRECTCSPHFGAHERHCGLEPIMPAAEWFTFKMPTV